MKNIKTAEEIFKLKFEEAAAKYPEKSWVNIDDPRIKPEIQITLDCMEEYANQFKPEWVSVEERLPETSEQLLVWQENLTDPDLSRIQKASFIESFFKIYPHSKDGYFKASENFVNYDLEGDKCQITHFMPLPQPPQK